MSSNAIPVGFDSNPYASSLRQSTEAHLACIEREVVPWAGAFAPLLRTSGEAFLAADMRVHVAVARRRRGEIVGGDDGLDLVVQADAILSGEGVRVPARWAAMIAPGFDSCAF